MAWETLLASVGGGFLGAGIAGYFVTRFTIARQEVRVDLKKVDLDFKGEFGELLGLLRLAQKQPLLGVLAAVLERLWNLKELDLSLESIEALVEGSKFFTRAAKTPKEKSFLGVQTAAVLGRIARASQVDSIVIDSGSTTAQAAKAIADQVARGGLGNVRTVVTNNIMGALFLTRAREKLRVCLVEGEIDPEFAGIFGDAAVNATKREAERALCAVLATTYFDLTSGPAANSPANTQLKRAVLDAPMPLIIIMESGKLDPALYAEPVCPSDVWLKRLKTHETHLIISAPVEDDGLEADEVTSRWRNFAFLTGIDRDGNPGQSSFAKEFSRLAGIPEPEVEPLRDDGNRAAHVTFRP